MFQSSNPALPRDDAFQEFYGDMARGRSATATLQGVVNKTAILVLIACVAGAGGYALSARFPSLTWISAIAAFGIVLGVGFVLRGKPALAPFLAPVYAVVEGVFLGSLTGVLDAQLASIASMKDVTGAAAASGATVSLALPAFLITVAVMVSMLLLYATRIIKPNRRFVAVVSTMAGGVMLTYMAMFVLSFFGIRMPFLTLAGAGASGWTPVIGIGLNVLILGVAAMVLIIDFQRVERLVDSGAPRVMEWYAGFALLVTLAWIYFEAVRLAFRLYLMFGSRD